LLYSGPKTLVTTSTKFMAVIRASSGISDMRDENSSCYLEQLGLDAAASNLGTC
jgi:hypothetical protein